VDNHLLHKVLWTVTALSLLLCFNEPVAVRADATAPPAPQASADLQSTGAIGANDVLHLDVVGQPDISQDYSVDPNGNITMLYVGRIHVGGLTIDEASDLIVKDLAKIYANPSASLRRTKVGGITVSVTGAVATQGTQSQRRDAHLNDALSQASPTSDADLSRVQVTRGLPGEDKSVLSFNLAAFLSTGDETNNPALADGDVIFVARKVPITYSISVVGAVNKPGRYNVDPGTTAYEAISLANGLAPDADPKTMYIQPTDTQDRLPLDYDAARMNPSDKASNPALKDGDKIVVAEAADAPTFTITGAVEKSGQYSLKGNVTLADAIGLAGGLEDHAKAKNTTVTRTTGKGGVQVLKVDASNPQVAATFVVQPADSIMVPRGSAPATVSPFEALGLLLTVITIVR
jgi:protein involved in polysaccharide export with SLBB domain